MRAFRSRENKLFAAGNDRPTDGHRRLVDVDVDIIADEDDLQIHSKRQLALYPQ